MNDYSPVGTAAGEFVPTHPGGEVGKPSPNSAKIGAFPSILLVYYTPEGANAPPPCGGRDEGFCPHPPGRRGGETFIKSRRKGRDTFVLISIVYAPKG